MKWRIELKLNDSMSEAPPTEYEADTLDDLLGAIEMEMTMDAYGWAMPPVGGALTVERLS